MIALILQNLQRIFNAYLLPTNPVVYSREQYKHSAGISEFSLSVSTRLGFSESSESKDDDSVHLMFTKND